MAREKEFPLNNGDTITVRQLTSARLEEAGRSLSKIGINVTLADAKLHENAVIQAELARVCLASWRRADGTEPLAGFSPVQARKYLGETSLPNVVLRLAQQLADEDASEYEVVSVN